MGMTNLEWLYEHDEYLNSFAKLMACLCGFSTDEFTANEWLRQEHSEPNPDCSAMLYKMFTENMKHEPCNDYEPKDDVSSYGADFNVVEPNFDNIEAVEMDASRFEAVEMGASRLVVREPDSREKLEADIKKYRWEHGETSGRVTEWLDRQAAITKRDTLHDNPTCSGSSTCAANRPISESADREAPDTAGIGASKDEIRDFDVWNVAYEIYCAGGYVDNGNEPNPPTDGIRELLDRQAAITQHEITERWAEHLHPIERECGDLRRKVAELTAELDKLKELNGYHAVQYELASEDADRLQAQVDRLTAELEKAMNNLNSANEDFENARAELTAERDYWKEQFMHCLTVAIRQERGDVLDRLMSYPRPADLIEPYQLVTDEVCTLRDFLAESEKERELYRKKLGR